MGLNLKELHQYYIEHNIHYKKKIPFIHFVYNLLYLSIILFLLLFFLLPKKEETKIIEEDKYLSTLYKLNSYIGNDDIAYNIVYYCYELNVCPYLLTAICETESNFKQYAVNKNYDGSYDRGLFQLNSNSFPNLKNIYDIKINIYNGIKHFKWCLIKSENNEIKALAMYNAGYGKVKRYNVGEATLDYINKIMKIRNKLNE